jgi:ribonuclease P protein component
LAALPGTGLIGFATAKKIGCHARRNRLRRRFQSAFRQLKFDPKPPLDLIVIVGMAAQDVGIQEIGEELGMLLQKIEGRWAGESEFS